MKKKREKERSYYYAKGIVYTCLHLVYIGYNRWIVGEVSLSGYSE